MLKLVIDSFVSYAQFEIQGVLPDGRIIGRKEEPLPLDVITSSGKHGACVCNDQPCICDSAAFYVLFYDYSAKALTAIEHLFLFENSEEVKFFITSLN